MSTQSTNPKDKIGKTKPSTHFIPPAAVIEESMVMALGAKKYGPFNWRGATVATSVYLDAIDRHRLAYLDGQDNDPESGVNHLAHIRAGAGILLDAIAQGTVVDDRPIKGKAAELLEKFTKIAERIPGIGEQIYYTEPVGFNHILDLSEHDNRPTCYLAGPMRNHACLNFPAFNQAQARLEADGWRVISPAEMDRLAAEPWTDPLRPDYADETYPFTQADIDRLIERDVKIILSLNPLADSIVVLPNYTHSIGATAEVAVGHWRRIMVCDYMPFTQPAARARKMKG